MIPEHSAIHGKPEITGFPIIDREITLGTSDDIELLKDGITSLEW
jgi:hypothetical protein